MSFDVVVVCLLAVFALTLFVMELIRADLVAIIVMTGLALFGVITPDEAVSGFSNSATLTVMNMFILSAAIFKTGALNLVGEKILDVSKNSVKKAGLLLMLLVGITSMFINNTAAVALLIPVTLQMCKKADWSPTKLLIPISFASMFGGVCTLVGTSTNLLANGILRDKGYETFSMFSFFHYGIVFFVVGILYLYFVGNKFIKPRRKFQNIERSYELEKFISVVEVLKDSPVIGKNINVQAPLKDFGVEILYKEEESEKSSNIIKEGDLLRVQADVDALDNLTKEQGFKIVSPSTGDINEERLGERQFIEVVVAPGSRIEGKFFSDIDFFDDYHAEVVAIRQRRGIVHKELDRILLKSGDTLLMLIPKHKADILRASNLFVVIKEPERRDFKIDKMFPALLILSIVILLAALNIVPILISSFAGVSAMVLLKVINLSDAYKAVDWSVIFLLAGLLALGKAMDRSGVAEMISTGLVNYVGPYGEMTMIAAFFILTVSMTSFMSNNASVALMTPLAIYSAEGLNLDPQTLVLSVMFAASMSFLTPVGYQTNMMIYNVGQYKFKDYLYVGAPLCFIFLILASFLLS